jgi:hypothetical protein
MNPSPRHRQSFALTGRNWWPVETGGRSPLVAGRNWWPVETGGGDLLAIVRTNVGSGSQSSILFVANWSPDRLWNFRIQSKQTDAADPGCDPLHAIRLSIL